MVFGELFDLLHGAPVAVEVAGARSAGANRAAIAKPVAPAIREFRPEACIHLAWYVEPGKYLDSPQNIAYLASSMQLLQLLIDTGCQQVVMTGTCAEYDTDTGYLKETSPTRPSTLYAAAKLSLSLLGQQLAQDAGVRFAWARIFYLYGDNEDPRRMVPALINALMIAEPGGSAVLPEP